MLNALRKGAGGFISKILIALLVLAFVAWGIGDVFKSFGTNSLATVGNRELTPEDFQQVYKDEISRMSMQIGQRLSTDQARKLGLPGRALNRLVTLTAMEMHAADLKLGASDEKIKKEILDSPSFQGMDGNFSKDNFVKFLSENRMTEASYISILKQDDMRGQITASLLSHVSVPQKLMETKHLYDNETRQIRYISLSDKVLGEISKPQEADIKSYYEKNQDEFKTPEYRNISFFTLSANKLKENITIDSKQIEESYNNEKSEYIKKERRTLKQMIFPDLEKAKAAHKKLKEGKKFDDVAKDTGQGEKDVNLGSQTKDGMVDKDIAEAAFKLKDGDVSEPVKGQFSSVILMVTKIEPEEITPFEKVKDKIRDKLALEKASEKMTEIRENIENDRGNIAFKDIAAKNNLKFSQIQIDRSGKDETGKTHEDLPQNSALLEAIFSAESGQDNDVAEIDDTTLVWYAVNEKIPSKIKDLKDVQEQVVKKILDDKKLDALKLKAQALVDALNKGGDFEKTAKDLNLKIETSEVFKRADANDKLPKTIIVQSFSLMKGKFSHGTSEDGKSLVVFQLVYVKKPEPLDETKRKALEPALSNQIMNDALSQYLQGLQNKYGVEINRAALEQVYNQSR